MSEVDADNSLSSGGRAGHGERCGVGEEVADVGPGGRFFFDEGAKKVSVSSLIGIEAVGESGRWLNEVLKVRLSDDPAERLAVGEGPSSASTSTGG